LVRPSLWQRVLQRDLQACRDFGLAGHSIVGTLMDAIVAGRITG
jgi:hypothetical protein